MRLEPELEQQLDQLARRLGKSRSACVREALRHYLQRFGDVAEARRQSQVLAAQERQEHWSEKLPDWSDWTA